MRPGFTNEASVTERILAAYDGLPNSERLIADYVLAHPNAITKMSAKDIAQSSGSSAASMSRFVKSLGFSGFAELSFALERDEVVRSPAEAPEGLFSRANLDEIIDYVLAVKMEELTATARYLKTSKLSEVVELIRNARLTIFAGVGNSISTAQNAAFKLTQTGYRATACSTSDGSSLIALTLSEQDVLVLISTTGYSKRLVNVVENAHKVGASVVIITDKEDSELGHLADIVLKTSTHDRLLTRNLRFSQNPINFVIELITVLLYHGSTDAEELARIFDENMFFDRGLRKTDDSATTP